MKEGSDNFKESSVINIIKKIKNHKIPIIIYEPLLRKQTFLNSKVITNFTEFADSASIIWPTDLMKNSILIWKRLLRETFFKKIKNNLNEE